MKKLTKLEIETEKLAKKVEEFEKTSSEEYYDDVIKNAPDIDAGNVTTGDKNVETGNISKVEKLWKQMKTKFKTWKTNYATEAALLRGLSGYVALSWLTIQTIILWWIKDR